MLMLPVSVAASGTLITGHAGQYYNIYGFVIVSAGTVTAKFQDGNTDLTGAMSMVVGVPIMAWPIVSEGVRVPWFQTASGNDFKIVLGTGVQVSGFLLYEPVVG